MTSLRDELLAIDREADETAQVGMQSMGATVVDDTEKADRLAIEGHGNPIECPGCAVGLPEGTERCPKCTMLIRTEHHVVPDRVRTLKEAMTRIRDEMPKREKRYADMAIGGAKGGKRSKRSKATNAKYNKAKTHKDTHQQENDHETD